jgi:hypothetical protein
VTEQPPLPVPPDQARDHDRTITVPRWLMRRICADLHFMIGVLRSSGAVPTMPEIQNSSIPTEHLNAMGYLINRLGFVEAHAKAVLEHTDIDQDEDLDD